MYFDGPYFGKVYGGGGGARSTKGGGMRRGYKGECADCMKDLSCKECAQSGSCTSDCKDKGEKGFHGFGLGPPQYLGPPATLCPKGYYKVSGFPVPYCVPINPPSSGGGIQVPPASIEVVACESWWKKTNDSGQCQYDTAKVGLAAAAALFFLTAVMR